MLKTRMLILFILLTLSNLLYGQDSTALNTPNYMGEIKASVRIDTQEIPQNKTATLIIEVSWQGDFDRFEIARVENPLLTNLEVVGNASSNWVGEVDGIKQVVKTYEFNLKPESLGMAYIDGTFVEYIDLRTARKHKLVTNRLELEVVPPVFEGSQNNVMLLVLVVLVLMSFSGGVLLLIKRKKMKEAELKEQQDAAVSFEEKFQVQLKENVDLNSSDGAGQFVSISKIVRGYIAKKYDLAALEMTYSDITTALEKTSLNGAAITHIEEVLQKCDVAKFSGLQVEKGSLDRVYTLAEEILKQTLNNVPDEQRDEKEEEHSTAN